MSDFFLLFLSPVWVGCNTDDVVLLYHCIINHNLSAVNFMLSGERDSDVPYFNVLNSSTGVNTLSKRVLAKAADRIRASTA